MVTLEKNQTISKYAEPNSSPRISFSTDFLEENNFISINAKPDHGTTDKDKSPARDFEFLSTNPITKTMITADELFFEGKLLPFWEIQHIEKLSHITLKENDKEKMEEKIVNNNDGSDKNNCRREKWFIDDDPSPRPPKCTVLWKELMRLKKQRATAPSLSPSSSSSSSSASSAKLKDLPMSEEGKNDKHVKRIKKGLERTRSASIRIRPMVNVPVCVQRKSKELAPFFSLKKGRSER